MNFPFRGFNSRAFYAQVRLVFTVSTIIFCSLRTAWGFRFLIHVALTQCFTDLHLNFPWLPFRKLTGGKQENFCFLPCNGLFPFAPQKSISVEWANAKEISNPCPFSCFSLLLSAVLWLNFMQGKRILSAELASRVFLTSARNRQSRLPWRL